MFWVWVGHVVRMSLLWFLFEHTDVLNAKQRMLAVALHRSSMTTADEEKLAVQLAELDQLQKASRLLLSRLAIVGYTDNSVSSSW